MPVNWCPALGTVLANEEVIDGVSERGGHPVLRKVNNDIPRFKKQEDLFSLVTILISSF